MNDTSAEVMQDFLDSGALLHGHFVLRSGLHSREFFQCALLLQHAPVAAKVCGMLAEKLRCFGDATVVSPAIGGIVVGQEVARHLGRRHIFLEKDTAGGLVLRRGFRVIPDEAFVVAEDVVTRGGRVMQTIEVIRSLGGRVLAAGAIVDRSGSALPDFGCPFVSLVQMTPETFPADALPPDLADTPAIKPGS